MNMSKEARELVTSSGVMCRSLLSSLRVLWKTLGTPGAETTAEAIKAQCREKLIALSDSMWWTGPMPPSLKAGPRNGRTKRGKA